MEGLEQGGQVVDLVNLAAQHGRGVRWAHQGQDLNVNLVVFDEGFGVDEHVNDEVEVLLIGVAGEGIVTIGDQQVTLRTGHLLVIPKGARRATGGTGGRFAYLTCHRRRGHLWPQPASSGAGDIPTGGVADRDR